MWVPRSRPDSCYPSSLQFFSSYSSSPQISGRLSRKDLEWPKWCNEVFSNKYESATYQWFPCPAAGTGSSLSRWRRSVSPQTAGSSRTPRVLEFRLSASCFSLFLPRLPHRRTLRRPPSAFSPLRQRHSLRSGRNQKPKKHWVGKQLWDFS